MDWDVGIQRISELEMSRLEQGDIILELAPLGKRGAHNNGMELLGRIADETGVSVTTLDTRRRVSSSFGRTMRDQVESSGVRVAYQTIRAVALDAGELDLKFECLMQLVKAAQASSSKHVTYEQYKSAWNQVYASEQERQEQVADGLRKIDIVGHNLSRLVSWARLTKFNARQRELAMERLEKDRDTLNLVIEALNPHSQIDWDAELLKLGESGNA